VTRDYPPPRAAAPARCGPLAVAPAAQPPAAPSLAIGSGPQVAAPPPDVYVDPSVLIPLPSPSSVVGTALPGLPPVVVARPAQAAPAAPSPLAAAPIAPVEVKTDPGVPPAPDRNAPRVSQPPQVSPNVVRRVTNPKVQSLQAALADLEIEDEFDIPTFLRRHSNHGPEKQ
jgi:hypothetical protein